MAEEMDMDTDCLNLANFPSEVLLQIFSCLNGSNLLDVSQVCTRFQSIAKEAFGEKFNGNSEHEYFKIRATGGEGFVDEQERYRPYFEIFGKQMTALNLDFAGRHFPRIPEKIRRNHWLPEIIKLHCPSLRHIIVSNNGGWTSSGTIDHLLQELKSLTLKELYRKESFLLCDRHYAHLTRFAAKDITHLNSDTLRHFLRINPQLKHLSLTNCRDFSINVLQDISGRLNDLESLELVFDSWRSMDIGDIFPDVILDQLKSVSISVVDESFVKVLGAIARGCKMIRQLKIFKFDEDIESSLSNDNIANVICGFDQLTSLSLHGFDFELLVVTRLPQLISSLEMHNTKCLDITLDSHHVLDAFTKYKQLKKLLIHNPKRTMDTVNKYLDFELVFDTIFHCKFADIAQNGRENMKYEYIDDTDNTRIVATKDGLNLNGKLKLIEREVFLVSNLNHTKFLLKRFGDRIRKLKVNMETTDVIEIWDLINENWAEKLIFLQVLNPKVNVMNTLNLSIPNLERLEFQNLDSEGPSIFPSMNCPKLNHLVLTDCSMERQVDTLDFGICLDHLTAITIHGSFDYFAETLSKLDDRICDQLKSFEVHDANANITSLINIAARFRNLFVLKFPHISIETANTKYLFERCTKLKQLSLRYGNNSANWRRMLKDIKENCKDLESLNLYHSNNNRIDFIDISCSIEICC